MSDNELVLESKPPIITKLFLLGIKFMEWFLRGQGG
jgi:hypothetical protein